MADRKTVSDAQLVKAARTALETAYAPYSKFHVGAAALTDNGKVFTGANVENASYGLTVCAERVAVFKAVSEGERKITRLAVVSSSNEETYPCGACRQVLKEFSKDLHVIVENRTGWTDRLKLDDLLPHAFDGGSLQRT